MRKTAIKTAELELEINWFHIYFEHESELSARDFATFHFYLNGKYCEEDVEFGIIERYLLKNHKEQVFENSYVHYDEGNEDYRPHKVKRIQWQDVATQWLYNDTKIQLEILNYLLNK